MATIKRRSGQRKVSSWSKGEKRNDQGLTFVDIGRFQLLLIHARRHRLKKCSATAKSTGERCGQLAMPNGKCRFHGGKTPSGDNWHVVQSDVSGHKTGMRRFDQKMNRIERARAERRLRLMRATDAERAAYEKWLWARPAGSAAKREARRAEAKFKRKLVCEEQNLLQTMRQNPADPDTIAIEARISQLREMQRLRKLSKTGVFE